MDESMTGSAVRELLLGPNVPQWQPQPGEPASAAHLRRTIGRPFDEAWTRGELDLRSRSIATMSMLLAMGCVEELRIHFAAAFRLGLSYEELIEIVLQAAYYCGSPRAHQAHRVLREVAAARSAEGAGSKEG